MACGAGEGLGTAVPGTWAHFEGLLSPDEGLLITEARRKLAAICNCNWFKGGVKIIVHV